MSKLRARGSERASQTSNATRQSHHGLRNVARRYSKRLIGHCAMAQKAAGFAPHGARTGTPAYSSFSSFNKNFELARRAEQEASLGVLPLMQSYSSFWHSRS